MATISLGVLDNISDVATGPSSYQQQQNVLLQGTVARAFGAFTQYELIWERHNLTKQWS
ncbi:hypothetical protein BO94DRAFT_623016 [Aspergillus sclerotioniger CBS 115572]|uniref:Prion-inhibition and propagation HeLo domain-containing protein n=1 Tax=Aspergillus sclerotioniger CBS 115572 TaxID=1450535 RepID=A0A317X4V6_9EURO|nr:hypothetical protein BO94DRAFT_623016 [Aspergillus sclerotioniger CBS 115572]PWY91590.1 hypothetical protein BO94DRAFT_623016 [Aspergillus sclerotioniger CBS 115572]